MDNNNENKARELNDQLFSAPNNTQGDQVRPPEFNNGSAQTVPPKPKKSKVEIDIKNLWLNIAIVLLTLVIAFTGAFIGVGCICGTALFGDSDFFAAFIVNNSGIELHRAEVDRISGQYTGDRIELSKKVLNSTVLIRVTASVNGTYSTAVSGSGIILEYEPDTGVTYIVTNHHVIYGAETFFVETYSGNQYRGEILHMDEICDLALVKIVSNEELTPVTVADSDKAVAGQDIVAAGNPRGLGFSVSFGYVSHPSRDNGDMGGNLIQMDISVNPGNSGGGVYDSQGNLLGVTVSKEVGDNVDGIGYAIPSNRMLSVISDLMKYGYVKGRASIGISAFTVTSSNYTTLMEGELKGYLPTVGGRVYGLYVKESTANIVSGEQIQMGDRIVSADGMPIHSITDLRSVLARLTPHSTIELVISRIEGVDGDTTLFKEFTVKILLGERDWADE